MSNPKVKSNIPYYDFSEHENKIIMPKHSSIHTQKRRGTFKDENAISIIKKPGGLAKLKIHKDKEE